MTQPTPNTASPATAHPASTTVPILIVGASGKTGRRVADRLTAEGHTVRGVSRSSTPRFDWNDRSTWEPALDGVRAAYLTYAPDLAFPGAADIVGDFADLAVAQGVRRLVLLSGRGEEGARAAEIRLEQSGADWTVVRCAFFSQNFSETFAEPVRHGVLAMPGGDVLEPFVDARDIADVVVASLLDDRHVGQLYELTGPRLLTFAGAMAEVADAVGRAVRYVPLDAASYAGELTRHGMPAEDAEPLAALIEEVLDGRNSYVTDGVTRALGRPARDFADFARDAAARGVWEAPAEDARKAS